MMMEREYRYSLFSSRLLTNEVESLDEGLLCNDKAQQSHIFLVNYYNS